MDLVPIRPPGRSTRRAGAYATEILRLRSEGYTFDAIREALARVGVMVSISTVQREAGRPFAQPATALTAISDASAATTASEKISQVETTAAPPRQSGREIAEEFFRLNPSNPLLRLKDSP